MFSLILPTYNEAANIPPLVDAISRVLEGRDFEIVVADDDSPDQTWKVAEDLGNPRVRVLRRTENRGLSPAVIDGFGVAKGDLLGVMDADMQHDEAILPQMIDALETHEFAVGSRAVEGGGYGDWSATRRLASFGASLMARLIVGTPLSDPMSGFFALRREVFDRARPRLSPRGFKIMLEIFCLASPDPFTEVPYTFRNRLAGDSKLSTKVMGQYVKSLFELRGKMRRGSP